MITPTSVEPYMLHGVTPMVFSIHSHVRESIGSPLNEMRSRASPRPSASPEARSMRATVGACRRGVARALTGDPPEEPVVERNHADAWEEPLPALGVAPDEQQARPAVVHAKPHAVGAEQREERDRDRTAFQDPEHGAVEGERGIEHHGDAVTLRDPVGLEEVGEA